MKVALCMLFLLCCANMLLAQKNQSPHSRDSLPVEDSSIAALKKDIQDNLPVISLGEDELEDGSSSGVSSILTAGRDPFLSAAEFNFSPVRFRLRGYETQGSAIYLNGLNFSGLDNGFTPFGLWSGLNNVMRSRQTFYGLAAADFAIGTIGLNTNIDVRASAQWAQTQVGYAFSNRNYSHRINYSHGSGFNHKGWAYSLALTARYAGEGYIPGTYYNGLSYYAAVDKKIDTKNILSLIGFGAPTETGRQTGSVQEAMDLAGTNFYNPSWGYQNGKKRNANVQQSFQPSFMLVHEYAPSTKTNWTTSVAYVFGKRKTSAFDWYNAPDPRPDYYRYLPSYYEHSQPNQAASLRELFKNYPDMLQVNWNRLYDVNRGNTVTINNVNGEGGNNVSGNRSLYILSNRVNDQRRLMANTGYHTQLNSHSSLAAGANFQQQINHYYQEVNDLLGGDFWLNVNQFAERDFPNNPQSMQYDIDKPNQLIKAGEHYGYNYRMAMTRMAIWAQATVSLNRFDLFMGSELSATSFYRTGLNRNGLFPEESFGDSPKQKFLNTHSKAGITWKLNGRNYFFVNGAYLSAPPYFENVFISQRTRNAMQNNLKSETFQSAEGGYKFLAPHAKLTLTGYYTRSRNGYDIMTFYHDQYQNFVNYALSGIDKLFFGGELGTEVKLTSTLSFNGAAAVGRYYYDSRQHAVVTVDNSAAVIAEQTVYLKNYRIPSTPQNAYSAGLFYRSPKFWFASLTANYFDNIWLSVNPLRRTAEAIGDMEPDAAETLGAAHLILAQEKFKSQYTLDFFGGWTKRLPKKFYIHNKPSYLVFNLSINNILNNMQIRSGGYEQLRFDYENKDVHKFPPRYYYAYGLTYFASVGFRFN